MAAEANYLFGAVSESEPHCSIHREFEKALDFIQRLVVSASNPFVDNVQDGLLFNSSGNKKSRQTNHGQTSVDDFSFFSDTKVKVGHVTVSGVLLVSGFGEKGISERRRAEGSHQGNGEEVGVGGQDDGTFVGDSVLSRDGGKSSPCLEVNHGLRVRDQSVSLAVSSGTDEEPSEHGVSAVPLFGVDRGTPSVLGELGELLGPVSTGIVHDLRGGQRAFAHFTKDSVE